MPQLLPCSPLHHGTACIRGVARLQPRRTAAVVAGATPWLPRSLDTSNRQGRVRRHLNVSFTRHEIVMAVGGALWVGGVVVDSLRPVQPPSNRLRATRATPPGLASGDDDRRAIYGAALQQFDDLFAAARAIGPVSRPLPVYYAVHQAGKAIAAAWVPRDFRPRSHGLTEHVPDESSQWQDNVLLFRVKPQRQPGVFGAVASALGTARLTGSAEIGALWSALPEVS